MYSEMNRSDAGSAAAGSATNVDPTSDKPAIVTTVRERTATPYVRFVLVTPR